MTELNIGEEELLAARTAFARFELDAAIHHFDSYIARLETEIQTIHAVMTKRIDAITEQSKNYLDGLNTPGDSAFFADTKEKLEQAIPVIYQYYELIAVAKTERAQTSLCQAKSMAALQDLPYQGMRSQYGFDKFEQMKLWQGEDLQGSGTVILPPLALSEELYYINYYQPLISQLKDCLVVADIQLVKLLQQSLQGCAVVGLKKNQTISQIDPRFQYRIHAEMLPWYYEQHQLSLPDSKQLFVSFDAKNQAGIIVDICSEKNINEYLLNTLKAYQQPVTIFSDSTAVCDKLEQHVGADKLIFAKRANAMTVEEKLSHIAAAAVIIAEESDSLYLAAMMDKNCFMLADKPIWQSYATDQIPMLENITIVYNHDQTTIDQMHNQLINSV